MTKSAPTAPPSQSIHDKTGAYITRLGYYLLWFEFLRMSPSYHLAHKYNGGGWTAADQAASPADFGKVLEVYASLGDVQNQRFRDWWLARAFDAFGTFGKRPRVERLRHLTPTDGRSPYFSAEADDFVDNQWQTSGQQDTVIVAIPLGLSRRQIAKSINAILDKSPGSELRTAPPKYPLQATNLHRHSYFRYLYALWVRCAFHDEPLWKIGVRARLSGTYSGRLDVDADKDRNTKTEDKDRLKILSHRAIDRGKMMSENAARGVFPSYDKCPNAMRFDLETLNKLRVARRANGY